MHAYGTLPSSTFLKPWKHPGGMTIRLRLELEYGTSFQKILHITRYHSDLIAVMAVHLILHIRLITACMGIHHPAGPKAPPGAMRVLSAFFMAPSLY